MISCLCVTHERHEFMPWVEHQFFKQRDRAAGELLIFDSSAEVWVSKSSDVEVIHCPGSPGISAKRTLAMAHAEEWLTWFDDDDWQSPLKLGHAIQDDDSLSAIGSRHGTLYSTVTGKCCPYESRYEPIIFNSAVYRKSAVPPTFNTELKTGEDTEWHDRFFRSYPTFLTLGQPTHAWLCHYKNITNNHASKFFDLTSTIPFDDWERDFLAKLHT